MSVPSLALSSRQHNSVSVFLVGAVTFVLALLGVLAVIIGLLNLDEPNSYALVPLGAIVFVGSTLWGTRKIRAVTGISRGQQFLAANAILVFAFFYLPILILIVFSFNAGRIPTIWRCMVRIPTARSGRSAT